MDDREALRAQLLARIADDDQVRARLAADGSLFHGYHPEMEAVHRDNARWLAGVVEQRGWPGRSTVGDDGAAAAWRIVQHAIGEPAVMRALFGVVSAAARAGDVDPRHAAMLDDRIRALEGRLQRYGTQYDWDASGTAMVPMVGVEDPDTVDQRRAEVGLPPIEWRRAPPSDEPPPRDRAARRAAADEWARRRGWR